MSTQHEINQAKADAAHAEYLADRQEDNQPAYPCDPCVDGHGNVTSGYPGMTYRQEMCKAVASAMSQTVQPDILAGAVVTLADAIIAEEARTRKGGGDE